ncbi:NAD(P)H-binding protein [Mycobacterium sp.]|uniref:NAD(P)H-binding protein n=1 Tax=Mycobacterium sp. TaxID=1785 RepID=UPI002C397236|nr:NAD(P)H-binding protein [Mycobacterium sp.]HME50049.1 NAD(P)H-binding protein [Mycobacterium sp.]
MTIVITGATGNVGRPLVEELVNAGANVRAVSRRPDAHGLPAGAEPVDSATAAIPGASAVFLNSRALGDEMTATIEAARREGVSRLVALSAINADDDFSRQPSRFRGDRNKEVEQLAIESGLQWVSLRPSLFASNFAGMWSAQIRAGDIVNGPYASAASAPIAESDIGAVAARALLGDDLVGQKVELTGPQSLTNEELVEIIGTVLGRPLRYREIPADLVRQRFLGLGFPAEFGDAYVALLSATVDKPALVTHDVEKILGRAARSFAGWVAEHRNLFTN